MSSYYVFMSQRLDLERAAMVLAIVLLVTVVVSRQMMTEQRGWHHLCLFFCTLVWVPMWFTFWVNSGIFFAVSLSIHKGWGLLAGVALAAAVPICIGMAIDCVSKALRRVTRHAAA